MEYWGGCSVMSKHANEVGGSERKGKREKGKGKTIALQTLQVSPSQRGVDSGPEAKINIPVQSAVQSTLLVSNPTARQSKSAKPMRVGQKPESASLCLS
jgi:hypothetical protein